MARYNKDADLYAQEVSKRLLPERSSNEIAAKAFGPAVVAATIGLLLGDNVNPVIVFALAVSAAVGVAYFDGRLMWKKYQKVYDDAYERYIERDAD